MRALRLCVCEREECVCAGGEGIISGSTVGGFQADGGGEVGGLSSSIFHGFSPFRSAASHTRLTGPFSFIPKHLSQTRRARGFGRLWRQEVAATRVRGDTRVFFIGRSRLFSRSGCSVVVLRIAVFRGVCLFAVAQREEGQFWSGLFPL